MVDQLDPDPRTRLLFGVPVTAAVDTAIDAHVAASDPHGDRAAATSALAAHVVASDPHADRAFATSAISTHAAASDPHGDRAAASSALATHVAASDPHADRAFATAAIATHSAATDPHADRAFTTSSIATHAAASDPHGDRAAATSALATHAAAADPHTGYQKESEKDAAGGYAGLDGSSKLTGSQQTYGTGANTACQGNDSRLSDARTPTAHASSHGSAGSDAISINTSQITAGTLAAARMPALTGDVTTSAGAVAATIANDAVTYAKMQNVSATDKLLGRSTAGSGDVEEITCTAAGRALIDDADAAAQRTTLGLAALATKATAGTSDIDNDAVTYAKIQNVSATDKLLGRSTAGAGDVEEITCTAAGRALIDDADAAAQRTTLGLGTIATQAAASVSISGGTITDITDLAVADGGTGASTAAEARTNLGLDTAATQVYEEGTWTPTITGATTAGSTTYSIQLGKYIRIGKQITVHFSVEWSGATGTGFMQIGGLPYTSVGSTYSGGSVAILEQFTVANGCALRLDPVQTLMYLSKYVSGGNSAAAAMQAAGRIDGSITYYKA